MSRKRAGVANLDDLTAIAIEELKQRPYKDVKRVIKTLIPEAKVRVVSWNYGLYSVEFPNSSNDNLKEPTLQLRC